MAEEDLGKDAPMKHHIIDAEALAFAEVVSYIKKYGQIGGDLNVFELDMAR